jgi:putative endonuclease
MYSVYVLHSKKDGKLYIGSTPDLRKRFHKHITGYVLSTKNRLPVELIYYESYFLETDALRREKFLKSGAGRKLLAVQLHDIFVKLGYNYSRENAVWSSAKR